MTTRSYCKQTIINDLLTEKEREFYIDDKHLIKCNKENSEKPEEKKLKAYNPKKREMK